MHMAQRASKPGRWLRTNFWSWAFALGSMAAPVNGATPTPADALKQMRAAPGFEVKLVASEPDIRQPVTMTFDERGRLWVLQYLQYPTPAGLKPVKVDQYLRTKYDQLPPPPPRGPKGADRVTICEDTDGDGRMDKFKDFVTGLNLASGMCLGHGGLFVAQPPYLLFYADKNRDDLPDGDPEVLLTGFGMEDAHAFANSLQWGPDGWLYGAHGSTVSANIRGIEFQQGIWRYHPLTKEFELFAEGGGNTWGLDFDEDGEIIAGTNFGDVIGLHQVQGAYYVKGFTKHGPLHNPHTYGYFEHIPFKGFKGGHVTSGGIVYQGGAFPPEFNGAYIAANVLSHAVYWHKLVRKGSSFTGQFGGPLIETDDETFRPIDCLTGPDGAVYVADWCDPRATHLDPLDTWDRSNGRIYKLQASGAPAVAAKFDLARRSSQELIKLLADPNNWMRREARRLLAERRDAKILPSLRLQLLGAANDQLALETLWALHVSGGFNDTLVKQFLTHGSEQVRAWTIRLLGDARKLSSSQQKLLASAAHNGTSPIIRRQLAATAKRLPGKDALPIIRELLERDEDTEDPQIPLLLWWAIESKALSDRADVVALFASSSFWQHALVRRFIAGRLARRYAAEGTPKDYATCARLLTLAPDFATVEVLLNGMGEALVGRTFDEPPPSLEVWFDKAWPVHPRSSTLLRFGVRLGLEPVRSLVLTRIRDVQTPEADRIGLIEILGQVGQTESVPGLLELLEKSPSEKLRAAALTALQRFPEARIARALLVIYPGLSTDLRARARSALCSRPAWAAALVGAVEAGRFDAKEVAFDQLRQMRELQDVELNQRIEKRWGKVGTEAPEEKRNFINELKLVLKPSGAAARTGKGNGEEGRKIFAQACGVCHKLFGEGNTLGPDLTSADRRNTDTLLANIVTPSAYIRPEYVGFEAVTKDDQTIAGLMVESTADAVTLLDRNNQRQVLVRSELKDLKEATHSLMPEGLLEALSPQQVMDLFTYLQGEGR